MDKMEQTQSITETKKSLTPEAERRKHRIRAGAFLTLIGGVGAIAGFSRTLMSARQHDEKLYEKATIETANLLEAGHKLATRALLWGTFYAFLGTGTFCYGIWKLSGAKNMDEFRQKMGSILPRLTKDAPPTSRTEFDGMNDLMEYLSTWRKEQ